MHISLFSTLYSSMPHPEEKFAVLRNAGSFFNWGEKAYEIKPYAVNASSSPELIAIKESKPSLLNTILRIAAYITVIIPLIMLIGALIYHAANNFQMAQDIFKTNSIGKNILSQLTKEELLTLRLTSQGNKVQAESELIYRLNSQKITLEDLGISTFTNLNQFFGLRRFEISTLDLRNFEIYDENVNLLLTFPNLTQLILKGAEITNLSFLSYSQMQDLKKLELLECNHITDFSVLGNLKDLKAINLSRCTKIADFNFLSEMEKLEELNLFGCRQITNAIIPLLQSLQGLKKLDISRCNQITDFSFMQHLQKLEELDLSWCIQVRSINFLENMPSITSLNLTACNIAGIDGLLNLKELKNLNLSLCKRLTDISVLQELVNNLEKVDITGCVHTPQFDYFFNKYKNLRQAGTTEQHL